MTLKDRITAKLTSILLWRVALGALVLVCLTLAGIIWTSGTDETRDAMHQGRRLLVKLVTGAIEGKQISLEKPPEKAEEKTEEKPAETAAAAAPPENPPTAPENHDAAPLSPATQDAAPTPAATDENTEAPPPQRLVTPEDLVQTPPPLSDDSEPVTPAAVPLSELKKELMEKSSAGILPVIAADGTKPWRYYAKRYERRGNLPMIAIIVTGLGQNKTATSGAIRLPENFSLSFSPYAKDVGSWATSARTAGHEILLDLPMEPSNYPASDPGPYGLLASKGPHENASRLQWLMARTQGYVGFVAPQNEVFSSNSDSFKALLQALEGRGLMLVLGHESAKTETKQILDAATTANSTGDVLIDEELSGPAIQARLVALAKIADKRGYAIGIAQAYPLTVEQLKLWSSQLEKAGVVLVPVTFITKLKFQ